MNFHGTRASRDVVDELLEDNLLQHQRHLLRLSQNNRLFLIMISQAQKALNLLASPPCDHQQEAAEARRRS